MAAGLEAAPGWYGKIPSLGDFASRRLPQLFIDVWDSWLQQSITASRAVLGAGWLDAYLNSPVWRFVLLPGVIGESMWAGLMMPSVDRVGRHFPLTIVVPVEPEPGRLAVVTSAQNWYAALEDSALATLSIDFSVQDFETRLADLAFPLGVAPTPVGGTDAMAGWWLNPSECFEMAMPTCNDLQGVMSGAASHCLQATGRGKSLWWHAMGDNGLSHLVCFGSLPAPGRYCAMLSGRAALTSVFVRPT
jgi:type VI secretion system protein ImpM